jgi:hypothetical protein
MASAPKISTTSAPPPAMVPASSVTRCWGAWPPVTSRIARVGAAPIRPATDRGKLSDRPSGARAPGVEISNWRTQATVSIAAAACAGSAPVSASAARAAPAASSTGDRRW